MCFSSCGLSERQEALRLVHHADSLFSSGELYNDTAQLISAVNTLERSSRFDHNELAHAYYYLGRNYDIMHLDSKEVPCFFRCIELKPQDRTYVGRSYVNLMAICTHSGDNELALTLSKKAIKNYKKSKDNKLYYESKIHYAELLVNSESRIDEGIKILKELEPQIGTNMQISTLYHSVLSSAYCNNKEYDKALSTINEIHCDSIILWSYQCHRLLVLCNIYEHLNNSQGVDSCINAILKCTDNSLFTSTACDYLQDSSFIENSNKYERLYEIIKIKNKRILDSSEESKAAELIKRYISSKKKDKITNIIIIFVLLSLFILSIITIERKNSHLSTINYLRDNITQLFIQLNNAEKSIRQEYCQNRKLIVEKRCNEYKSRKTINWKDYDNFRRIINTDFFEIVDKLEMNYKLNEKEIKLCIMVMIGYDKKYIAEHLFMAENSVGKTKLRVAKKLNTTIAELPVFLKKMAADFIQN